MREPRLDFERYAKRLLADLVKETTLGDRVGFVEGYLRACAQVGYMLASADHIAGGPFHDDPFGAGHIPEAALSIALGERPPARAPLSDDYLAKAVIRFEHLRPAAPPVQQWQLDIENVVALILDHLKRGR